MSGAIFSKRENNFDLLRLSLAIIVAIVHLGYLSQNPLLFNVSQLLSSEIAVESFFVVSGFLIFMSYESCSSIREYALKRVKRIAPGYVTVIIVCAFAGYFISEREAVEYFGLDFVKFLFFNLLTLNFVAPTLPGVFDQNAWQAVNGALWTIKIEWMFYAAVPLIAMMLARFNKIAVLGGIYLLSFACSSVMFWYLEQSGNTDLFLQLQKQLPGQLVYFVSGALLYYNYSFFKKYANWLLLPSVLLLIAERFGLNITIVYPLLLSICIIYAATILPYLGNFGKFGDLSFGIYIWHFPIIQSFVVWNLFENVAAGVLSLMVTLFAVAFLSWHLVEKRFLNPSSHYRVAEEESKSSI